MPQLHTPYIAPSENGGREGVRWAALMADAPASTGTPATAVALLVSHRHGQAAAGEREHAWGVRRDGGEPVAEGGATFVPSEGLHMSVSNFSTGQLLLAKHDNELEAGPCKLHIDGFHMGVGGDDSWTPSVRPFAPLCAPAPQMLSFDQCHDVYGSRVPRWDVVAAAA